MTLVKQGIMVISSITMSWLVSADEFSAHSARYGAKHHPGDLTPISSSVFPRQTQQPSETDLIWKGVTSSFEFPYEELENKTFLDGLSGNVGINFPLTKTEAANIPDDNTQGSANHNITGTLSLKYVIAGNWFVSGTFYAYVDRDQQQPWNPDYTYVFGYSDWRPYTLSLIYSNYGGNRFSPGPGEKATYFERGTWSLGWKFPITSPVKEWFTLTDEGAIGCQIDYNLTPEYFDLESVSYQKNQKTFSLGCKYAIFGNWYVNATAFYYPDKTQQQPWNPDYTYGFGYFDWRPGTFTIQYNNYSGNRWNSSQRGENTGRFKDGAITLAYSFSF
jgi:hypothetical protein